MKKYFVIILMLFIGANFLTPVLAASDSAGGGFSFDDYNESKFVAEGTKGQLNASDIIGNIIKGVVSILGVLFIVLLVYSGYEWMIGGTDSEKIKRAKQRIVNSVIGLIIILSAYAITQFVLSQIADSTKSEQEMQEINRAIEERDARDQEYRDNIYKAIN